MSRLIEVEIGEDCFDLEVDGSMDEVELPNTARRWWGPTKEESDVVTLETVVREFALGNDLTLNDARRAFEERCHTMLIEVYCDEYEESRV